MPGGPLGRSVHGVKIGKIREALHAQPFRPFWIHLADGGRLPVQHGDFVALDPAGREMVVCLPDSRRHLVEVMLVTRLEVKARNGATPRKKR